MLERRFSFILQILPSPQARREKKTKRKEEETINNRNSVKKKKKKTTKFFFNPSKIIDHRRQCRDVYFKSIGRGRRRGWNDRGTKRNHPRSTGFLSSRSNFHFNQRRARVGHNPEGRNGLKQFLRSKQIFYRYSKPVCTFEREFYFRVSLLERGKRRGRGERERDGEQKGRQEFSSRSFVPLPPPLLFISLSVPSVREQF